VDSKPVDAVARACVLLPAASVLDFRREARHPAAMRKRVHIALAVLLVMLAGVIGWQMLHLREPIYQGKRLSSWLEAYKLYGVAGVETWQVRVEQQEADEAVRRIGTNALPTLLRMLRAKDSALKAKLMDLAQKQHFIHINYIPADELNYRACSAFGVLRAKAQSAVPAMIRIYEQNISPASQFYVSRALIAIGPDATRTAIPAFLRGAANSNLLVRKSGRSRRSMMNPHWSCPHWRSP
jgi:hypothetical protein